MNATHTIRVILRGVALWEGETAGRLALRIGCTESVLRGVLDGTSPESDVRDVAHLVARGAKLDLSSNERSALIQYAVRGQ